MAAGNTNTLILLGVAFIGLYFFKDDVMGLINDIKGDLLSGPSNGGNGDEDKDTKDSKNGNGGGGGSDVKSSGGSGSKSKDSKTIKQSVIQKGKKPNSNISSILNKNKSINADTKAKINEALSKAFNSFSVRLA